MSLHEGVSGEIRSDGHGDQWGTGNIKVSNPVSDGKGKIHSDGKGNQWGTGGIEVSNPVSDGKGGIVTDGHGNQRGVGGVKVSDASASTAPSKPEPQMGVGSPRAEEIASEQMGHESPQGQNPSTAPSHEPQKPNPMPQRHSGHGPHMGGVRALQAAAPVPVATIRRAHNDIADATTDAERIAAVKREQHLLGVKEDGIEGGQTRRALAAATHHHGHQSSPHHHHRPMSGHTM